MNWGWIEGLIAVVRFSFLVDVMFPEYGWWLWRAVCVIVSVRACEI